MEGETKACANCRQAFTIEPKDFAFYEKMKVPAPAWCPKCRLQRRLMFMNERALYKRSCDLCKRDFISLFPAETPYTVYCAKCFWDKWDPLSYGREIDFSKPFLQQYAELLKEAPRTGQQQVTPTMTNSDYCCICSYLKNCYLVFNSDYAEDCGYCTYLEHTKNSFDLFMADLAELCYESSHLYKTNRVFFSDNCNECVDVAFSKNLTGCTDCFGCVNLRNKSYHIFNQPYSKEEYKRELAKYNTGSYAACERIKERVDALALLLPRKYMEGVNNRNASGDHIFNSKNTFISYEVTGAQDSKYCQFLFIAPTSDSYDLTMWGGNAARTYECMGAGGGSDNVAFCFEVYGEFSDVRYSLETSVSGSHQFGCYALMQKEYCILNKQYSKEEYEALVPKIIAHMNEMPYRDAKGREYKYGEFFPSELSAFAYNESIAQDYFPLSKEDALAQGYQWKNPEEKHYVVTLASKDIPDEINEVDEKILDAVIACAHGGTCNEQCAGAFKVIPQELQFLKRMHLPLPRLCANCRHHGRLRKYDLLTLWHRTCQCSKDGHFHAAGSCPNEFETSYSSERPDIVYCEQCYNAEVV